MEDHATRRKIIRQWMALPKDKRQTAEQAAAFAKCPFRNFLNRLNLLDSKEVV